MRWAFGVGKLSTEGPGWIKHVIARSEVTWQSASPAVQSTARPQRGRKRTDCRVGLCPPRNDVVTLSRAFFCRCGSGHPGRGVPTGFYFGSFAALGTSYSSHRRVVGLRPPPTIHGGDWDDRKGRPYRWSLNPSSPAPRTVLPRGSGSMSHDSHPALSSRRYGPAHPP